MGRSTAAQLIAKGKAENSYNNSGIKTDAQWLDFFNDALRDLVDDLGIRKMGTIAYDTEREYPLADDYYYLLSMNDANNNRVAKRRNYDQQYPEGYWIFYRGGSHVIDLYRYSAAQTFTYLYQAYPAELADTNATPEVPSVGEKALVYYAIAKSLRNNSHADEAREYEGLYERERLKIRTAAARGGG